jgi:antitoxin component YwqK of YwqJK toxin-antitoxin module
MRLRFFIGLMMGAVLTLPAQNQLDEQGRKYGHWKVDYPNGRTLYEAEFKEGRPVGTMTRYYENGAVRARMNFDSTGSRCFTQMLYPSGKKAAEGWYLDQQKDSVWTYYSPQDGSVRIREPYNMGKLQGKVRNYYPSGRVSEEIEWDNNVRQGEWNQYYNNGVPRLSSHYENDLLNGHYEVYFGNGKIKIRGEHLKGRINGTWSYFDEEGKELISHEFVNGIPVDREGYNQWVQDSLEKYQNISIPESLPQF